MKTDLVVVTLPRNALMTSIGLNAPITAPMTGKTKTNNCPEGGDHNGQRLLGVSPASLCSRQNVGALNETVNLIQALCMIYISN